MSTLSLGEQRDVISLWTRKEDWKLVEITFVASVYSNLSYKVLFESNKKVLFNNTNFLSFQV